MASRLGILADSCTGHLGLASVSPNRKALKTVSPRCFDRGAQIPAIHRSKGHDSLTPSLSEGSGPAGLQISGLRVLFIACAEVPRACSCLKASAMSLLSEAIPIKMETASSSTTGPSRIEPQPRCLDRDQSPQPQRDVLSSEVSATQVKNPSYRITAEINDSMQESDSHFDLGLRVVD